MTPEERLIGAIEAARRVGPDQAALERMTLALATPRAPWRVKWPLVVGLGAPIAALGVIAALLGPGRSSRAPEVDVAPLVTRIARDPLSLPLPLAPTISTDDVPRVAQPAPHAFASSADQELALVEQAEETLRTDPKGALVLTNELARAYPTGQLVEEREVIAIDALSKLGREDEARARANLFFRAWPGSPYETRIRRAL